VLSCNEQESFSTFYIKTQIKDLNFGDYIPAKVTYSNNDIYTKEIDSYLKYRGNTSSSYNKKNFSLKFSTKQCFKNLDCNKKWKLNAEYVDKTLMRNKLSYDLFRSFSKKNIAPKINYTLVYLNDSFHGIYSLTQKVDQQLLKLYKNDTNALIFKHAPISQPTEKHKENHFNFIEFSNWAPFYKPFSERAMNKLLKEVYYNQRYPSINKINKKEEIHKITDYLYNSNDSEFSDSTLFNTYFDINNLIDWHLLLLITNNGDGLIKNFYIYKQGTNTPFRICPWDYDHSFGRDGGGGLDLESFIDISRVKILDRLIKTNAFNYNKKLYAKFLLLKKNNILTSANINKMIDQNIKIITPYIEKNEKRWPLDSLDHFKETNFKNEIILMQKWIKQRLPKVESHLFQLKNNIGKIAQ